MTVHGTIAAYPEVADMANRIQQRLEERAREEAENCSDEFGSWMAEDDRNDSMAIAIVSAFIRGTSESIAAAKRCAWQLLDDWVQYRIANADADELAEIERAIVEEYAV